MSRFDFFQVANPDSTTLVAPTLKIYNYKSAIDSFYRMTAPYQFICECCGGMSSQDTLTITNVTEEKSDFKSVPMEHFLAFNNSRALHHHEFFELMIVLEGAVINRIEDEEHTYTEGTCCLLNRNIRHAEAFNGPAKLLFLDLAPSFVEELTEFYKAPHFPGELESLNDIALQFMQTDMLHPGKKDYLYFLPLFQNNAGLQQLRDLSDRLLQTAQTPSFGTAYLVRGMICSLIRFLCCDTNYHVTQINLDSQGDFLLFLQISHLLEDRNGRMSRQEIAEACNYSGSHINRIVQKYGGMSLFDYSMTFCMKKAAALLTETELTISEIMRQLDFSNANHFYQIFRKYYGMTPMKYRKTC